MTASISDCRIQLNKSLLFEIVFIAGWIPRLNYTFEKMKRTNAKYYSSSHLCVGVRECVVQESACMACKRSPVRSRYSPPKSTVLRRKYGAFLFAEADFGGLHCFACTIFRRFLYNPQLLTLRHFQKECLPPGFSAGCCIIPFNRRSKRRWSPTIREAAAFVDYRISQP